MPEEKNVKEVMDTEPVPVKGKKRKSDEAAKAIDVTISKRKTGITLKEAEASTSGKPDKPNVPGMTGGKEDIAAKYKAFQTQMKALADDNGIATDIDTNLEMLGSIVMAAMTENKKLSTKGEYEFHLWDLDGSVLGTTKVKIDLTVLETWVEKNISPRDKRGSWYPFLAALQLADKVKDTILWQRNTVTKALGVPSICEPYAVGHNIKDKLKKSRPLSVGPLVHLLHLKNLDETQNKKGNKGLTEMAYRAIRSRLIKILKKQSIGVAQKSLIDSISGGKWELISTLALSYLAIKPHIEHHFVLTYPFIYHMADFDGANFTNEWVWQAVASCSNKFNVFGPAKWKCFMYQLHFHSIFQTAGEDLGLLGWITGAKFLQRKDFGKFGKKEEFDDLGPWAFDYKYWTKPMKGAPVNIKGSGGGQISTRPSLKGKRALFNKYSKLDDLKKDYSLVTSDDFYAAINEEFEKYAAVAIEGSTVFYKKGGSDPVPAEEVVTDKVYLLAN